MFPSSLAMRRGLPSDQCQYLLASEQSASTPLLAPSIALSDKSVAPHSRLHSSSCALFQSASSPEPIAEEELEGLQMESGMEKSMIEELLRKYGFGSWTKPEEVWKGRQIGHYSVSASD